MARTNTVPQPARLLIVTTAADLSLQLLVEAAGSCAFETKVLFFEQAMPEFSEALDGASFDIVYVRDPFNVEGWDPESIKQRLELLSQTQPDAYYVDHTSTWQDVQFEDKWEQYAVLKSYMPHTEILTRQEQFRQGRNIIKKRIAARSKGLYFDLSSFMLDGNYIIQPFLQFVREYRVFVIRGRVLRTASLRMSKTPQQRLGTIKTLQLSNKVEAFAARIAEQLPDFDLLGLDIAELPDGRQVLIEANRSCQFKKFAQLGGINPALELFEALSNRPSPPAHLGRRHAGDNRLL